MFDEWFLFAVFSNQSKMDGSLRYSHTRKKEVSNQRWQNHSLPIVICITTPHEISILMSLQFMTFNVFIADMNIFFWRRWYFNNLWTPKKCIPKIALTSRTEPLKVGELWCTQRVKMKIYSSWFDIQIVNFYDFSSLK